MKVANNSPHEIKHFTFGKVDNSLDLCFGWNVDVIDIHQNFPFALQSRVQHPQSKLKQSFKS